MKGFSLFALVFFYASSAIYSVAIANWELPADARDNHGDFRSCSWDASNKVVICRNSIPLNDSGTLHVTESLTLRFVQNQSLPGGMVIAPSENFNTTIDAQGGLNFNSGGITRIHANIYSPNHSVNLNSDVSVFGDLNVNTININSGASVMGSIAAAGSVENNGNVYGNIDSNGSVTVNSGASAYSVNARGSMHNNGFVRDYINSPTITNHGEARITCDENQNFGPCSGFISISEVCESIWPQDATEHFETGNPFPIPQDPDYTSLPSSGPLQVGDYVINGPLTIGANRSNVHISTSGTTTRVFIDGDLQLGLTGAPGQSPDVWLNHSGNNPGPPENLLVIINGDLIVGEKVRASGFFFVNGDVSVKATGGGNNRFLVDGSLTTTGSLAQDFKNNTDINYIPPPSNLDSGGFCKAVTDTQSPPVPNLSLKLNDGPWTESAPQVEDSAPFSLNGIAFNGVGFSREAPAIITNPAGMGTCGYASFDASQQQYIEVPHSTNLSFAESFTVGTWVRPKTLPRSGLMTILSKDTNYEFHLNPDGTINWWWNNTNGSIVEFNSQHAVNIGEWNYIAIRYTPTTQTIFVNGQRTNFHNNQGITQNSLPIQIGSDQNFAGRYFNGDIDEVTVLQGALSDESIHELSQRVSACQPEAAQCFPVYDFDAAESLESHWIVRPAQTTGQNRKPRIVDNALRLTDDVGHQSTLVSLRRVFPAAGNLVEVEFKLNAYGGSGADGIAVVLSDANQSPEPGGFGGSLGYAQRDGNISGFNGGWLGIGFDSYGNYAQATEQRVGGLNRSRNQTTNMVSMRGANETNYRFVPGGHSGQLSPDIRSTGNTRGPGHTYRIRIDSRSVSESFVSVERDTGNGFEYIIDPIDIYDALDGQQPAVPENFRLSFTGSTGDLTDIHELEDIQVCAALSAPIDGGIDHLRLQHPGTLVSCYAAGIEVIACLNADCSSTANHDGQVTLQATPAAQWRGAAVVDSDNNNAQIALTQGRATLQLSKSEGGTVDITAIGTSYPLATGALDLRCFVGDQPENCNILYNTAGFVFYEANQTSLDLPPQISGVPFNSWLRAVETNTLTGACEARLEGSQEVHLGYECLNPGQCQPRQAMTLAGSTINNSGNNIVTQPTMLDFDANGYAPLDSNMYTDAGVVSLHASATLSEQPREGNGIADPTVTLSGSSQSFVVKPNELRVVTPALSTTNDGFVAAGEAFVLQVQALNAHGRVTPNFGMENTPAQPEINFAGLILPENGVADSSLFSTGELSRVNDPDYGIAYETDTAAWQEAGTIRVLPALRGNDYLGAGDIPLKTAADIGRFYPAYLELTQSELEDICLPGEPFTYLKQPGIWAFYEVTAKAENGNVTANYTPYDDDTDHLAAIDLASATEAIATDRIVAPQSLAWENGILKFQSEPDDVLVLRRGDGLSPEGPYPNTQLSLSVTESVDPVDFIDDTLLNGSLNLRYGRLVLNDVSGPEDESLRVDANSEYWDGSRFVINVDDFCTKLEAPDVSIESANEPSFDITTMSVTSPLSGNVLLRNGLTRPEQSLLLSPSNELVEIEYCYQAPPWLRYDWQNTTSCESSPSALAFFGQYRGNDRIIFWLERGL